MPTFPLRFSALLAAAASLCACTSRFSSTVVLNDKRDALIVIHGDRPLVELRAEGPVIATTTDARGSRDTQVIQAGILSQTMIQGGQVYLRSEGETLVKVQIQSADGVSIVQPAPPNSH